MKMQKISKIFSPQRIIVIVVTIALVVVSAILLHVMFSQSLTNLTAELLAATVAVVLVVASVGVTIHFQSKAETEHEYQVTLFDTKMKVYTEFLRITAKADDDAKIDDKEMEEIRNQACIVSRLAKVDLVVHLGHFISNLETTRDLLRGNDNGKGNDEDKNKDKGSFQQVIFSMREDIGVVDETTDPAKDAIRKLVRHRRLHADTHK